MRYLFFIGVILLLNACAYSQRASSLSNNELCGNLGKYSLYDNANAIEVTRNEIDGRNINKEECASIANKMIDQVAPKYKLSLCQHLAAYHYKGAYEHFKNTLTKIEKAGFADEECNTMADFYLIRLTRKQEKAQAIADALNQAAENLRRTNDQLYGRGSYFNPIYIKLQ